MESSYNKFQKYITKEHIKCYDYTTFRNARLISFGEFEDVNRVIFKRDKTTVVLKSFNSNGNNNYAIIKEIINEIKLYRKVDIHPNIIRFHGVTKKEDNVNTNTIPYMLVLEYADSGTLESYLRENFKYLTWNDKIRFALQTASAVRYLHSKRIVHLGLNSNNILIHQNNIKLSDIGLSKRLTKLKSNLNLREIPYMDPQYFIKNHDFKFDNNSDVYSIGILMWEIANGHLPFKNIIDANALIRNIVNGLQEDPYHEAPHQYIKIYTECWQGAPENRPTIQNVVLNLKALIASTNNPTLLQIPIQPQNYSISQNSTSLHNNFLLQSFTSSQNLNLQNSIPQLNFLN
ncbi:4261_t:CDS:2, partial [Scutellospora calospora]